MEVNEQILSDLIVYTKYAKFLPKQRRRETFKEIVDRNKAMHVKRYPRLKKEIDGVYKGVYEKTILPSMRSMQFAGDAIIRNHSRIYNCAFHTANSLEFFKETMFLLLGGCGVGYSVQSRHVADLPIIKKPRKNRKYLIADSIEGWADAVNKLIEAFFLGKFLPRFDYSEIRPKGAVLKTAGGLAPGPEPLRVCLSRILGLLESKATGAHLTSTEVSDIACFIADAVLSGGIRRAACIAFFDIEDEDMMSYKSGNWREKHPYRERVNISAVALRTKISEKTFKSLWDYTRANFSGEPGIFFTNDMEILSNPCFTGDTKILTSEGYRQFDEVVGDVELINKNGEMKNGHVWETGFKKVVQLNVSTGAIKCTPNHRLMTADGESIEAKDSLKKRLMPFYTIKRSVSDATIAGFIQGDGSLSRLNSPTHKGIEINIGAKDREIAEIMGIEYEEGKRTYYTGKFNDLIERFELEAKTLPYRELPKFEKGFTANDFYDFLTGLYSANGCVIKGHRVSFKTTCFKLSVQLGTWLENIGIQNYTTTNKSKEVEFSNGTYRCKESYDVNIVRLTSIIKFAEKISFVHGYKRKALEELILKKAPLVMSVHYESSQKKVYDFNIEDKGHWGVVEGVVAHNCGEISLKNKQFCNLTTINLSTIENQNQLEKACYDAGVLGSLQAGYTDFHYLTDEWAENCENESLLGISLTGIADGNSYKKFNWKKAVKVAKEANNYISQQIGTKQASRITCIKPEGTAALVLGTSSGIHARHALYYIKRVEYLKSEAVAQYLMKYHPEIVVEHLGKADGVKVEIPLKSPDRSIYRTESPISLLERIKYFYDNWVCNGHYEGINTHNISATVSVKDDEWEEVKAWLWDNRESYSGITVFPYDGGSYSQPPLEEISKERYEEMSKTLKKIDLTKIKETEDKTDLVGEMACGGVVGCSI